MHLPRTTSEQRQEIYGDVRDLIVFGFLAHPVAIGEARFVLRTLNDLEWRMLQFRAYGLPPREHQAWTVATSIWMINGTVLKGDEEVLYEVHEFLRALPQGILEDLYGVVNGLMRKLLAAAQVIEAFLYEEESRKLWRNEGAAFTAKHNTGDFLNSRNPVLKLWTSFNEQEDERERDEHTWTLAKFTASPHAPKGIKKLNAQEATRTSDLLRRRERVLDKTYYEVKGIIPRQVEKSQKRPGKFQEFRMAESAEELQDEMQRWVAGTKDEHDLVVDGVKTRIRIEVEGRKAADKARREAFASALEDEGISGSQMTPLSGEAGQAFIERMSARVPGSKVYGDNTHNSAYEKYIKNDPAAGDLRVSEEGQIVSAVTSDPRLLDLLRKPEASGKSLQQQVESRRPLASFEDEKE